MTTKMMQTVFKILLAVALVLGSMQADAVAGGKPVKVKLATLAPRGSTPYQILQTMDQEWQKSTGGRAKLTIYADGTQGSESETVKRMRIGQLQASLITGVGLADIDESVTCLQIMPMVFRSLEEMDYVQARLTPMLEKRLEAKGFVVLTWVDAGWIHYFTSKPVVTPEEFKKLRIFAWAGDNNTLDLMKSLGYQPLPLETADILPSLKTGMIDAVPAPPFYALAGQFYDPAPHMVNVNWAPLVGALVMTKKAWDEFNPEEQKAMRSAAEVAGKEMRAQARKENLEAIEAMKKRGLTVHTPTPEQVQAWENLAETAYPKIRGKLVPADLFDEVQKLLKEYRAKQP
jgi:TRAP-type C4-dicarboxylate transport system substrate-binding protein